MTLNFACFFITAEQSTDNAVVCVNVQHNRSDLSCFNKAAILACSLLKSRFILVDQNTNIDCEKCFLVSYADAG